MQKYMYFYTEKRGNGHMHCLSEEALYISSLPPCSHKQKQVYKGTSLAQHLPISLNDEPEKAQRALTLHFQITFQLQDPTDSVLFSTKFKAQFADDSIMLKQKFSPEKSQQFNVSEQSGCTKVFSPFPMSFERSE